MTHPKTVTSSLLLPLLTTLPFCKTVFWLQLIIATMPTRFFRLIPLVRSHRRPTTVSSRNRCASTSATPTTCTRRRRTERRTTRRSSSGSRRTRSQAGQQQPARPKCRSTCGPDGPSWACNSPRRCCSCSRTLWSGDDSTVFVFLTCWTWKKKKTNKHTVAYPKFLPEGRLNTFIVIRNLKQRSTVKVQ